ncbi:MAG TPA: hypothetical protein VJM53_04915 [Burkholderiales bacterium]|nr:hypothetical protein [Burkholderiales bacterium]
MKASCDEQLQTSDAAHSFARHSAADSAAAGFTVAACVAEVAESGYHTAEFADSIVRDSDPDTAFAFVAVLARTAEVATLSFGLNGEGLKRPC